MSVENESEGSDTEKKDNDVGNLAENMIFRIKNLSNKETELKKSNQDLIANNL